MLDFAQTMQLIERAKNNDESAKEKLILENSPLIKSIIKRYKDKGIDYDDLYQLGSLGFLKAINNFNSEFNVKFSTYAVPMIAGEIKRYLRDNGIIKVSRSTKSLAIQLNKYIESFVQNGLPSPSVDNIAQKFNLTPQEIVYALDSVKHPISLFSITGNDEGEDKQLCIIDKIENEKSLDSKLDNLNLIKIIKTLSPRDRKIVLLRYYRDKTQKEIAVLLGVSQVQISRLENKILNQIKIKMAD